MPPPSRLPLNAKQQEKEYSGFAETFAQKALNEELLGNYPDSRYLWSQAAEMDQKSKVAGAKAAFFREVAQNPAAFYSSPGSAPKPPKPSILASPSNTTATAAEKKTSAPWQEYLMKSARQVVLGNYTDDVTLAGTAGQVGLGLLGLDLPADIRDLSYDLTHLKTTPWHQTALDALALLPVVGGLKYVDEAAGLLKHGDEALAAAKAATQATKAATDLPDAAKQAHNLMDTGGDLVYNGATAGGKIDLKPAALMDELASSGKKYTPQDVIMVTKNSNGDLLWLEQGNDSAGLKHILQRHSTNFGQCGISSEDVPQFLREILQTEPIKTSHTKQGPFGIYTYNGNDYLVAYGTNGYVVSFYPYSIK